MPQSKFKQFLTDPNRRAVAMQLMQSLNTPAAGGANLNPVVTSVPGLSTISPVLTMPSTIGTPAPVQQVAMPQNTYIPGDDEWNEDKVKEIQGVTVVGKRMKKNNTALYIIGGLAVLGLALYFMKKK